MRVMRWMVLAAAVGACARDDKDTGATLAQDTALAADLREAAADTSAFSEAADVAMRDLPDSTLPMPAPSPMTTTPGRRPAIRPGGDLPSRGTPTPVTPPDLAPAPPPQATPPVPASAPAPAPAVVRADGCASPAMADQRRCLLAHLARSDVTLDRNYQARIAALKAEAGTPPGAPEPPSVQRLRTAQRAWLVYRDTECRNRNRGTEGPLWAPVRARCLAEFSAARAEELAP